MESVIRKTKVTTSGLYMYMCLHTHTCTHTRANTYIHMDTTHAFKKKFPAKAGDVVQLLGACLVCTRLWVQSPALHKRWLLVISELRR